MAAVNTKGSAVVVRVALPVALEQIAASVAGALQETASLSETLGTLTRDAGKLIKRQPEMLDPFVDACRQLCGSVGLTEGSFKVYLSNIRGVIRAMVLEGYNPKNGQSLRAMYDAAPKGTGRQKATGARPPSGATSAAADGATDGDTADEASAPAATVKPADAKRAAIVALFGHCDDELMAAMQWAAGHEMRFVALVKGQIAFDAKPVGAVTKPAARKAA